MKKARKESPIACNLAVMDADQRKRHRHIAGHLRSALQEIRELPDGYAFRLPAKECLAAAEFVALERLCCPFLHFVLELEPEEGPIWLRISGRGGVKEFLRVELQIDPAGKVRP